MTDSELASLEAKLRLADEACHFQHVDGDDVRVLITEFAKMKLALIALVRSYDEADQEKYDECKWEAFNSHDEIEKARELIK